VCGLFSSLCCAGGYKYELYSVLDGEVDWMDQQRIDEEGGELLWKRMRVQVVGSNRLPINRLSDIHQPADDFHGDEEKRINKLKMNSRISIAEGVSRQVRTLNR
jgi:hypothetical protein